MGCGCEEVERWLEDCADVPRGGRGPRAWRLHFRGEEHHLFPVWRTYFPDDVARLEREHHVFHDEIRRFGKIVSTALLKEHAALEDRLLRLSIEKGWIAS